MRVERRVVSASKDERVNARCLERLGDVGVDTFAGIGDDVSRGGEHRSGRRAFDQLEADFFFQLLDLLGHCRGGHHEDVGGGNDAAFAGDGQEEGQSARIDVHANSLIKANCKITIEPFNCA